MPINNGCFLWRVSTCSVNQRKFSNFGRIKLFNELHNEQTFYIQAIKCCGIAQLLCEGNEQKKRFCRFQANVTPSNSIHMQIYLYIFISIASFVLGWVQLTAQFRSGYKFSACICENSENNQRSFVCACTIYLISIFN